MTWPRRITISFLALAFSLPAVDSHVWGAQDPANAEIKTQETQPAFQVQVQRNLVLVRVIVRDGKGNAVGDLRQQDFQLFDDGKPQSISYFSVESPAKKPPEAVKPVPPGLALEGSPETSTVPFSALRYVALFFDDVHTSFDGIARTRDAAGKYLQASAQEGDRIGVFTASGQVMADFTDDRSKIREALFRLRPTPVAMTEPNECPDIFPYQAYLVVDRREEHALDEITAEILECRYHNDQRYLNEARGEAESDAVRVLTRDVNQSQYTFRGLEQLVRRMSALPGQRSVVMISPGFFTETERLTTEEVVDRALRSRVIISALDSKGLYAYVPIADATKEGIVIPQRPDLTGRKTQDQIDSNRYDLDVMSQLASGTGGVFFKNSNDFDEGFRTVGGLPEVAYVLGFSPLKLKTDGRFHLLKVKLMRNARLTVQARRGYFAPRKPVDPAGERKQDIEDAVFSQDELNGLPVDVHTQFFKVNERDTKLSVIAHLDVRLVRFRKEAGRNSNNITFVTTLFDRDGKYVTGREKTVEFHLFDHTLASLEQSGLSAKMSFDVPPGTYLVREVVRESEQGQLSGINRTVEIPF